MFNSKKIENLENKVNSLQEKVHALLNDQLSEVTYNQDSLRNMLEIVLKETVKNNETLAYILKNMQGQDKLIFSHVEDNLNKQDGKKRNDVSLYTSFISVKIPVSVLEYLIEKSRSGKKSPAIKRVFNRSGKLVLCPISIDVVDKINASYLSKHSLENIPYERCTVSVSTEMYDAFNKLAKMTNLKVIDVTSAFVYTYSTLEYGRIKEAFNSLTLNEELQQISK
jgi:hypothetical protein